MPQMSPLLWLNLYITFAITMLIFMSMFFFTKTPQQAPESTKTNFPEKLNWKW